MNLIASDVGPVLALGHHPSNEVVCLAGLRLQLDAFLAQSQELQTQLSVHTSLTGQTLSAVDIKLPVALERRLAVLNRLRPQRAVDDLELTLLALVDADGRLVLPSRAAHLLVLMARVSLADHRVLCVHVLSRASRETQTEFVRLGGLRLLRRWMTAAMKCDDGGSELVALIKLCSALPCNLDEMRQSGIGKTMSRVAKHKSSGPESEAILKYFHIHKGMFRAKISAPLRA
jgi:hypothetical protein